MTKEALMQMLNEIDAGLKTALTRVNELVAENKALKEALAQPKQEPVAWFSTLPDGRLSIKIVGKPTEGNWEPLYTTPPKRPWVGLTDDEIYKSAQKSGVLMRGVTSDDALDLAQAIEAKLKEKNT